MKTFIRSLTILLFSLSSFTAFAHSAIEPVPRNEQWWQDRHKSFNQRVAEVGEKAQVIFIGDSITQGWEGDGKEVWAKYYSPRNTINLGIGGDRTQHVLWRLDNGNLAGLKPKAAVVMIGTNNSNGEDNTPGQIVDGVTAIVKRLREKLPQTKVLLLSIFPRGENFNNQRGKILQVNQVLEKLADGQSIFWVDFGYQFVNSDGSIPRELMPDYLHLSPKGYAIWAEAVEDRLANILGGARVQPGQGGAGAPAANLTGEWAMTLSGQDGQSFDFTLILKAEEGKVTGKLSRGEDRWLQIESGKFSGNEFSWIVKRDRSDGTMTTYQVSGNIDGDKLTGKAKTKLEGNDVTNDWTAKRK